MIDQAGTAEKTDLLKMLLVVAKHKRLIVVTTLVCTVLAVILVLLLPNEYTAETKMLAPSEENSMEDLLSMQGALSGLGVAKSLSESALGLNDPNAPYIGELESRTVADRLIARFDLKRVYDTKLQEDTRKALWGATKVETSKDGGISIKVTDKDPKRAVDLANAYVQELQKLTDQLSSAEASKRSTYYDSEIRKVQEQLISSELALRSTQEKTGMLDVETQVKSVMVSAVNMEEAIAAKEVEIEGMSSFETPRNEDLKLAKNELAAMRTELAQLKNGNKSNSSDILLSTQKIPQDALEYLRNYRNVMFYEKLYDLLSVQYAAAKADEGRDAIVIQVYDPADQPEKKSQPHRALIVIFVMMLAVSGSLFASFALEGFEEMRRDPIRTQQLKSLKTMLLGGPIRTWFFRPKAK